MPRPAGTAKFPMTIAAAVAADLFARLDDWAAHQAVSKSQLIRQLITEHVPDLSKLVPRTTREEEHRP